MRVNSSRWRFVAGACAAALAAAAIAVLVVQHGQETKPGPTASGAVTIPAAGGADLAARVYTPAGDGPFPLVVMPGSWGSPPTEYAAVATGFAALGYEVVAYAQRGFGGSTGVIDFAGPATRGDVSAVIDWARAHTSANDKAVAAVGTSYGAGISLLAAEHDRRIKAVAAISGWADFAQALAPGDTPSEVDYRLLFTTAIAHRQVDPQLHTLVTQLAGDNAAAALAAARAMSPVRSPVDDVKALNQNKTAVFLASTYQDSVAWPGTMVTLYNRLTGPKHLELAPGDHGASALLGLYGQRSPLWISVAKWVAHYINNGASPAVRPVQLTDEQTGAVHGYPDWASVGTALTTPLGPATGRPATGTIKPSANAGWTESIAAGVPTLADAGPQQMTTGRIYQPPSLALAAVSRKAGLVWNAAPLAAATTINGEAHVHVNARTSASAASLFGYLYDVDPSGTGRLISFGARTVTGTAGGSRPVDITFAPISWTVPAGHHVCLVIDSVDARYLGRSVPGSTITLSSKASDPATLTVGVG